MSKPEFYAFFGLFCFSVAANAVGLSRIRSEVAALRRVISAYREHLD